jgi:formate dehydrogenase subunit gamma
MQRIPSRSGAFRLLSFVVLAALLIGASATNPASAQSVRPPSDATKNMVPGQPGDPESSRPPQQFETGPEAREAFGNSEGATSTSDFWSQLRHGAEGYSAVTGPGGQAGLAIQSTGENWRQFRNGTVATYGWWGMAGVAAACLLFFLVRGSMPVASGLSGKLIERFTFSERAGHWVVAISFLVLGLTGLNMLYGREALMPVMGPEAFASMTLVGKWSHFVSAFIFMIGLVWITVKWLPHNLPDKTDLMWFLKGGGYLIPGVHAHAKKFNPGQKIVFWLTVLGGISVSLSGLSLMLPFEFAMFSKTFYAINAVIGTELPTNLTAMQEMQLNQLWHGILSLFLMSVIVAHIYLGTIGLQGAFQAMTTGKVDLNWAKEHHDLWVEELEKKGAIQTTKDEPARGVPQQQPAE